MPRGAPAQGRPAPPVSQPDAALRRRLDRRRDLERRRALETQRRSGLQRARAAAATAITAVAAILLGVTDALNHETLAGTAQQPRRRGQRVVNWDTSPVSLRLRNVSDYQGFRGAFLIDAKAFEILARKVMPLWMTKHLPDLALSPRRPAHVHRVPGLCRSPP